MAKPSHHAHGHARRVALTDTSLEDVLRRCRDNVATKNVIHFITRNGAALPGNSPGLSTMSQTFARIRDEAGIKVADGKTPPSFHEIQSLAARLYAEERGPEFAQALLGHKTSLMTELYRDIRGREWTENQARSKLIAFSASYKTRIQVIDLSRCDGTF